MAGYTRQDTSNNISNGNVIDADDFDAEYNAVEAAFNATSGHSHDGTAGEGAPITKVGPAQDVVISGTQVLPKVTNTLDLGSAAVQFKDAFFDGTVDTDTLTVSGPATVGATLDVTGVVTATSGVVGDITGDVVGDVTGTVSSIINHDTDDLAEGSTNQYFTQGRARASISATGSIQYNNQTGVMSFTQGDTDTVAEGNTNLYYTTARATADAKAAISVTDAGGDGSLTYSSGAITYTGPSAAEVRAHFSGGTGVTYSAGQFSIGQPVGTSDNVTFNNAIVNGNLTVNGTTTSVNSNDVNIGDATLTLNSDETGTPSQDAGIVIERGTATNKSFLWDESEDEWSTFGERIKAGTFEGNLVGNVTGNVTGNADTATALATSRTISLAGDVTGSVSFNGTSNVSITATVQDDSHNHVISNVDGLQTALNGKAALAGSGSQAFSASTLNAGTVDLGNWTITESGGTLYFATGGTNKMKLDASGNLTVTGNVTGFGTV